MNLSDRAAVETVIEPPKGWQMIDFKELLAYRDLLFFLVKRDITVLYAQTVLGFVWAVVNPLVQIVVFSIIFGRIAKLDSEAIPYFLFSAVAIIPWTYMSDTMSAASQSLVGGQSMLGKVYFPRIIFPLTPIFAKLMDFGISLLLLLAVMIYYRVVANVESRIPTVVRAADDEHSCRRRILAFVVGHSIPRREVCDAVYRQDAHLLRPDSIFGSGDPGELSFLVFN